MTKAEIAKMKKAERNAKAYQANKEKLALEYEANKQKISEQNAQKKDEISFKNKEAYEKNKEVIADKYQKNKKVIKKAREKKIEAMSHKETDEFKEKNCEYAHEYYEKNKDMIKEKQEEREIAKALEHRGNQLHYRRDQIRKHKEDPLLYPHNPETYIAPPKKTRVHKPKNNEENKIICAVQEIVKETPEPIPAKKSNVKVNIKIKPKPAPTPPQELAPVLPIATETSSFLRILTYYDDDLEEDISFEEMSEEERFCIPRDEEHAQKQREYKFKFLKYRQYEQFKALERMRQQEHEV